jgi:hypothetical protein
LRRLPSATGVSGRVVLAGSVAEKPHRGGHTWLFLQYLLGFRRLGWDVLFLDRLKADMCRDAHGRPCAPVHSVNLRYLAQALRGAGLGDAWSVALDNGIHLGVDRRRALEHVASSDLLLTVMGFVTDEALLGAARRLIFLDIDPGFGQMWCDLGLADVFAGHDDFVTIGERIGRPDCTIPACGLRWITTPQPVVLDAWPAAPPAPEGAFTSVASWRSAYGPVHHAGRRYGLRVHEFRRFAELPRRARGTFELALHIDSTETADMNLLRSTGWRVIQPGSVAATPWSYRRYISASKAELMGGQGHVRDEPQRLANLDPPIRG